MEGESNLLKFSQVFHLMPVATSFVVTNGAHIVVCAPGAFPTYAVQCCATAKRARRTATYDPAPPLIRRYVPLELRLSAGCCGGAVLEALQASTAAVVGEKGVVGCYWSQ